MLEHHPKESRELTRVEALELLDQEHARGHLHSAWFKDAMMGRFYVICNCCKCPNKGLSLMRDEKKGVPLEVELLVN